MAFTQLEPGFAITAPPSFPRRTPCFDRKPYRAMGIPAPVVAQYVRREIASVPEKTISLAAVPADIPASRRAGGHARLRARRLQTAA